MANGHLLVLVGTAPAAPEYQVTADDFADLAREHGAAYFCDPAINRSEYVDLAARSRADVAISVNWPRLIGRPMLDVFPHGVINAHAGDLPRFRGNATQSWAILAGEPKIVLTLHRMVESLDAGPILIQRDIPLTPTTYVFDVYRSFALAVPDLFLQVLDGLEDGSLVARPQPDAPELSLRCFPRRPSDGELDWSRPAVELARLVRAAAEPFAGAYTFLGGTKAVVWRAHPEVVPYPVLGVPGQVVEIRRSTGEVSVLTGSGGLLVLEEMEVAPVGRQPAAQQVKSTRARFGMNVTAEVAELARRVQQLEDVISKLTS